MGGTDDPSNLIELTVEEHAAAHRKLFEQYGHWQDELAWKGLSRMIGREEIIREVVSRSNLGKKFSESHRKKLSEAASKCKNFLGKNHTKETKRKIGEANKQHQIGCGNSQYGTRWITDGFSNKKVSKDSHIPIGWRFGRTLRTTG
jgi:hypothetical protein